MPREVLGNARVEMLRFDDMELSLDGVFFLKAAISPSALVMGLETENGHVVVDRQCATNLPGCFAAGDCTGRPYQYVKAAGEGNVAAHSVVRYLG
jgi:thioredoxin reductase (NADPH)